MQEPLDSSGTTKALTGVNGLDDILGGGLTLNRLYLIEGVPGAGKTTLGLQYLLEGVRRGESVLYVTLSETREELLMTSASHGWSLDGVTIHELTPNDQNLAPQEAYTMFHPSEVELTQTIKAILEVVERTRPTRLVFDSLSEMRLLAGTPLRYRRQVLALKQYFAGRKCTVLVLDDLADSDHDLQVHSIAHGVVRLEQVSSDYGAERRRLRVVKYRGQAFRGGYHDFVIRRGGLDVFPRLVASEHRIGEFGGRLASGIQELDLLLGGGLERGTSTLIVGAPGTGKSSLAAQFVAAAAGRGQRAAMFLFDESVQTLVSRASGLGLDLQKHLVSGHVAVQKVDPAELSPGEFAARIRQAVETDDASVIVIDSLNGYLNATPDERFLTVHLHEILSFLGQHGVATIIIGAHQGIIGSQMSAPVDATYLADSVILLRYFEALGEVRQALSVIKKRGSAHERTIREFKLENGHISVGDPLRGFRGILTGVPQFDAPKSPPEKTTS